MSSTALPAAVAAHALVGKQFADELRAGTVPKHHAEFAARVASMCTADTQLPSEPDRFLGEYTVFWAFVDHMLHDVLDSELKLCAAIGTAHVGVAIAAHVVGELAKRVDRETDLRLLAATYQHLLTVRGFVGRDVSACLKQSARLAAGDFPIVASVQPPITIGTPVCSIDNQHVVYHVLAIDADTAVVASPTTSLHVQLHVLRSDWLFGWPSGTATLDAAMYLLQVLLVHVARIRTNQELVHDTMAQLQTMALPKAAIDFTRAHRTLRWLSGAAPLIVGNTRVYIPWDHDAVGVGVDAEYAARGGSRFTGFGLATARSDWCIVRTPRAYVEELRANPETVDIAMRWSGDMCVRYDEARRVTCIGWWPGGTVLRPATRLVADADVARAQVYYAIA